MPSSTSLASVMAVKDFDVAKKHDADHIWVPDRQREKIIHLGGEPHLLTPLVKKYTDPYGLLELPPKSNGCKHCNFMNVR